MLDHSPRQPIAVICALADELVHLREALPPGREEWRGDRCVWHTELDDARTLGERLLELAGRTADDSLQLQAHHALWATSLSRGELAACLEHASAGGSVYVAAKHSGLAAQFGNHDAGARAAQFHAWALALRGDVERARQLAERAVAASRAIEHPFSHALALFFAGALVEACRDVPVIVAYNVPFERTCIGLLAGAVPELAAELNAIGARMLDLLPVIQNHVYHPDFMGSLSLKSVLPALVPDMNHDALAVSDGQLASARLRRLIVDGQPADATERERLLHDLREYCRMDTLATVRLLEVLRGLAIH